MAASKPPQPRIAVAYLLRGADNSWHASCQRFIDSYLRHPAGTDHSLYVLFKGFPNQHMLDAASDMFASIAHQPLLLDDDSFDIGAYVEFANGIDAELICAMNTASELLAANWLAKLAANLALPGVGLVGASASYESLNDWNASFPKFPNVHLRSNAFMIRRELFCRLTRSLLIREKIDAFNFESGNSSISRQVQALGQSILLVGRNGRGYAPAFWPVSDTFRLGPQDNLLVGDNQTRNFSALSWNEKREFVLRTWGHFIRDFEMLK